MAPSAGPIRKKLLDHLVEISDRVYVLGTCLSAACLGGAEFEAYVARAVEQLRERFPEGSFMVFDFGGGGEERSKMSEMMSRHGMTVWEYPEQHHGCPLLPLGTIHFLLTFSDSWLSEDWHSVGGQEKVLLMHCERGGWPILAFVLAALLLHRRECSGEEETLDSVRGRAPKELMRLSCPLDPRPSHLRYLEYVCKEGSGGIERRPLETVLTLDCVVLTVLPARSREEGRGLTVRVYGKDPLTPANKGSRLLFSSPRMTTRDEEVGCAPAEVYVDCHVQGDVLLECIGETNDVHRDVVIFRVMFNTSFVQSNALVLSREEIDIPWSAKEQFPKDFKAVILFSDFEADGPHVTEDDSTEEGDDYEGASAEFFNANKVILNANSRGEKRDSELHDLPGVGMVDHRYMPYAITSQVDVDALCTPSPPPPSPRHAAFRALSTLSRKLSEKDSPQKQQPSSCLALANATWFTTNDTSCSSTTKSSSSPPPPPPAPPLGMHPTNLLETSPCYNGACFPTTFLSDGAQPPQAPTYRVPPPILTGKLLPLSPSLISGASSPSPSPPPIKARTTSFKPPPVLRKSPPPSPLSSDGSPSPYPLPPPQPLAIKPRRFVAHNGDKSIDFDSQGLKKSLRSIHDDARDVKEKVGNLETEFKALVDAQNRIMSILQKKASSFSSIDTKGKSSSRFSTP